MSDCFPGVSSFWCGFALPLFLLFKQNVKTRCVYPALVVNLLWCRHRLTLMLKKTICTSTIGRYTLLHIFSFKKIKHFWSKVLWSKKISSFVRTLSFVGNFNLLDILRKLQSMQSKLNYIFSTANSVLKAIIISFNSLV